jgi:hypothetical protein
MAGHGIVLFMPSNQELSGGLQSLIDGFGVDNNQPAQPANCIAEQPFQNPLSPSREASPVMFASLFQRQIPFGHVNLQKAGRTTKAAPLRCSFTEH